MPMTWTECRLTRPACVAHRDETGRWDPPPETRGLTDLATFCLDEAIWITNSPERTTGGDLVRLAESTPRARTYVAMAADDEFGTPRLPEGLERTEFGRTWQSARCEKGSLTRWSDMTDDRWRRWSETHQTPDPLSRYCKDRHIFVSWKAAPDRRAERVRRMLEFASTHDANVTDDMLEGTSLTKRPWLRPCDGTGAVDERELMAVVRRIDRRLRREGRQRITEKG